MYLHVRGDGLALDESPCPRTNAHAVLGVLGELGGSMSLLLLLLLTIHEALAVHEATLRHGPLTPPAPRL
jgi:hypothetical protein